jgi:hypothetical protein
MSTVELGGARTLLGVALVRGDKVIGAMPRFGGPRIADHMHAPRRGVGPVSHNDIPWVSRCTAR